MSTTDTPAAKAIARRMAARKAAATRRRQRHAAAKLREIENR